MVAARCTMIRSVAVLPRTTTRTRREASPPWGTTPNESGNGKRAGWPSPRGASANVVPDTVSPAESKTSTSTVVSSSGTAKSLSTTTTSWVGGALHAHVRTKSSPPQRTRRAYSSAPRDHPSSPTSKRTVLVVRSSKTVAAVRAP